MPKKLSLPGLYLINKIYFTVSNETKHSVVIFVVTDSYSRKKREYRFDALSISNESQNAVKAIDYFINTGHIWPGSKMSRYPTPYGYSQKMKIASLDKIRNQPCLVRYTYAGENIGMLFYPHQVSF